MKVWSDKEQRLVDFDVHVGDIISLELDRRVAGMYRFETWSTWGDISTSDAMDTNVSGHITYLDTGLVLGFSEWATKLATKHKVHKKITMPCGVFCVWSNGCVGYISVENLKVICS